MNKPVSTRVFIALEDHGPSTEVLKQLGRLFDPEAIELVGLLVEDEDLLRAARLPGFHEISLSGQIVALDPEHLRHQIDANLQRLREAFEAQVRAQPFRSRIEVMQGRWIESVRIAGQTADLIVISRSERASGLRLRAGVHFEPLLATGGTVLIVNEPWSSGHSVVVLGTEADAVEAGRRLAEPDRLDLVVVHKRGEPESKQLPSGSIRVQVDVWSEASITAVCRQWDARLMVVHSGSGVAQSLAALLDRLPCSLLWLG